MDKNGKTGRGYPQKEKAVAVRIVRTLRPELGTVRGKVQRIPLQLDYRVESVHC